MIVSNEELLAVLAALDSPSLVYTGLLSISILRPKKLSIVTTEETPQLFRIDKIPEILTTFKAFKTLFCGRLALAILVTFFLLVKVPK